VICEIVRNRGQEPNNDELGGADRVGCDREREECERHGDIILARGLAGVLTASKGAEGLLFAVQYEPAGLAR
jgi:hypothetical protein